MCWLVGAWWCSCKGKQTRERDRGRQGKAEEYSSRAEKEAVEYACKGNYRKEERDGVSEKNGRKI